MRASTDLEIDSWPVGEPFSLLPSMQSLTLRVILRAVFGYEPGAEEEDLRRRLRAMLEPLSRPRAMMLLAALPFGRGDRAAVDRPVRDRAARPSTRCCTPRSRAGAPIRTRSIERDDVFSALLLAEDEDGRAADRPRGPRRAGDAAARRPRDDRDRPRVDASTCCCTTPAVLDRARQGDERYLDAVVKESLRAPAGDPGRRARGPRRAVPPERLRDPAGRRDQPVDPDDPPRARTCTRTPRAFRPERFLVDDPPDTYTWIPFGGGTRRCLGASFALMEMRIVIAPRARARRSAGRRPEARQGPVPRDHAGAARRHAGDSRSPAEPG